MGNRTGLSTEESEAEIKKVVERHSKVYTAPEVEEWYILFHESYPKSDAKFARGVPRDVFLVDNMSIHGGDELLWERVFSAVSTDGEVISFADMMNQMAIVARGTMEELLSWTFRFFDKDRSGLIDRNEIERGLSQLLKTLEGVELAQHMSPNQNTPEKRTRELMRNFDLEKDGRITEEEFVAGCQADPSIMEALDVYMQEAYKGACASYENVSNEKVARLLRAHGR
eukprot:Hpha_TRINITY_DN5695_c0_g1::TRINITY_DN5695_c0_g1_i1::g.50673::m.50673